MKRELCTTSFTGCRESPVLLRATAAMADVDAKLYTSVGAYDLRAAGGRPGPAVGTLLRSTGLDVYLLQGVGAEQMHTLAPYLSEKYHLIHYLHPDATLKDGVAIALRRERLEPVSSRPRLLGSYEAGRADRVVPREPRRRRDRLRGRARVGRAPRLRDGRPRRRVHRARAAAPLRAARAAAPGRLERGAPRDGPVVGAPLLLGRRRAVVERRRLRVGLRQRLGRAARRRARRLRRGGADGARPHARRRVGAARRGARRTRASTSRRAAPRSGRRSPSASSPPAAGRSARPGRRRGTTRARRPPSGARARCSWPRSTAREARITTESALQFQEGGGGSERPGEPQHVCVSED